MIPTLLPALQLRRQVVTCRPSGAIKAQYVKTAPSRLSMVDALSLRPGVGCQLVAAQARRRLHLQATAAFIDPQVSPSKTMLLKQSEIDLS